MSHLLTYQLPSPTPKADVMSSLLTHLCPNSQHTSYLLRSSEAYKCQSSPLFLNQTVPSNCVKLTSRVSKAIRHYSKSSCRKCVALTCTCRADGSQVFRIHSFRVTFRWAGCKRFAASCSTSTANRFVKVIA